MTQMRRRVVGILGMPGFRVRALVGSWCIYSGYRQLELTHTTSSDSRASTALSFVRTGCTAKGKVYVDIWAR
jgi:UDP-N-acetylglucosamine enolpyruvyl transferase